jgi:hypothetical protein
MVVQFEVQYTYTKSTAPLHTTPQKMGCASSVELERGHTLRRLIGNPDRFRSFDEVEAALRRAGLESSQLIIGIDCTRSNTWNGAKTFGGRSLHQISGSKNPYEQVIEIVGKTLSPFDSDGQIPVFGFGDSSTTNRSVFSFKGSNGAGGGEGAGEAGAGSDATCFGFGDALAAYRAVVPTLQLSGPTSFAPIIRKAIEILQRDGGYHILVIIADGEITDREATTSAIIRASQYSLSIIVVGVGDGPWETMEEYDDQLPQRRFDNFQFVNFHAIMNDPKIENHEAAFAMHALMECPDQYAFMKRNGMLRYSTGTDAGTHCRVPGGV